MPTYSILVTGKVQGVFFRQTTKKTAHDLKLTGQVWNNKDGTVGIVVSGDKPTLTRFVKYCHIGSAQSRVEKVEVAEIEEMEFSGFEIIRKS